MRTLEALIALITIVVPSVANARNLVIVGSVFELGERALFVVDTDTIKDVGEYKRVWTYEGIKAAKEKPIIASSFIEVDCAHERYREIQASYYEPEQAFDRVNKNTAWHYPTPNSHPETSVRLTCGKANLPTKNTLGDEDPIMILRRVVQSIP